MSAPVILAVVMLAALILYAVMAGADFGGGVWDLVSTPPQRKLIERALAPVWEANHVWLILLVVILFTAFPAAFAALLTGLHVPLTLMLVGIVLRGSAFVFRQYGGGSAGAQAAWGRVFAVASALTPLFLGACLGAMTTGGAWLAVFPLCVGLFAVALFAMLAAVYLTLEASKEPALQRTFRARAFGAALVAAALGVLTGLVSPFSVGFELAVSVVPGLGLLAALGLNRFALARACAVALVALVIGGWGVHQYPVLWPPAVTVQSAAAPAATLGLLIPTLAVGAVLLLPSLWWLMRVFKSRPLP